MADVAQATPQTAAPAATYGIDPQQIAAARSYGYSDQDITSYLSKTTDAPIAKAQQYGYSPTQILDFLAPPPPEPAPEPDKSSTLWGATKGFGVGLINSVGSAIEGVGHMAQSGAQDLHQEAAAEDVRKATVLSVFDDIDNKMDVPKVIRDATGVRLNPSIFANYISASPEGRDAIRAQFAGEGKATGGIIDQGAGILGAAGKYEAAGGQAISGWAEKQLTDEERGRWNVKATSMLGGLVPYVGAALVGDLPALIGVGGVQGYGEAYDAAKAAGKSDDTAASAGLLNGMVQGGMMAVPVHTAMSVMDALPGVAKSSVLKGIVELAKSSGTMVGFSQLSTLADNAVAKATYDPQRDIMAGVGQDLGEQALVGAVLPIAGIAARAGGDLAKRAVAPVEKPAVADILDADSIEEAINKAADAVAEPAAVPDIEAAATAPAAENVPDTQQAVHETEQPQQEAQPEVTAAMDDAAREADAKAKDDFLTTGEPPEPQEQPEVAATRPSPAPDEPAYSEALQRATTYQRWLGELDEKRRQEAAASPQAAFLQQTADAILRKVNGVEDRLTDAAAARLDDARQTLNDLLNPEGDSPDMAKVRAAMVAEHQRMADAAAVKSKEQVAAVTEEAQKLGEPVTPQEAEAISSHMDAHGMDAGSAAAEHVERKAIQEVSSDHEQTGDKAYGEAVPVDEGTGEADRGIGQGFEGRVVEPGSEGAAPEAREPVAGDTGEVREPITEVSAEPTRFTTAKGSTYEVHDDGTTTRDKAARPDVGHEGQSGPQPRSEATFYVTKEHANELGLFQAEGVGAHMAVVERPDGTAGVKYLDGKDAGKFEKRTVAKVSKEPAPGFIPVETWKNGTRVHFGNEITKVTKGAETKSADITDLAKRRALKTQNPEGKGETITRALNAEETKALENEDQQKQASDLADKDYDRAVQVAMRERQPPKGVLPSFVFFEVERRATRDGDVPLLMRLAKSPLAEEVTTAGRTIQSFTTRDPQSAVARIQDIQGARMNAAAARHGNLMNAEAAVTAKADKTIKAAVKAQIVRRLPPLEELHNFIQSIKCA